MSGDNFNFVFKFELNNADHYHFDADREYKWVISPYSRLYLVTKGRGWLKFANEKILLEPGFLYLIPSLQACSYFFEKELDHYFIHFSLQLMNGLSVYSVYSTTKKAEAQKLDYFLFERLLELNPGLKLSHHDPKIYQRKGTIQKTMFNSAARLNETRGIIDQLFSRFIDSETNLDATVLLKHNLYEITEYIGSNLNKQITVEELAIKAHVSTDHFIRIFKQATTYTPGEYIVRKRVEMAQTMLLTTEMPLKRIIDELGFQSLSYFSRVFKRYTDLSPSEYRKLRH